MKNDGFTALEVITTIGILVILFSVGTYSFSLLQKTKSEYAAKDIITSLVTASRHARNGIEGSSWGVYLPYNDISRYTNELVIFSGDDYLSRDPAQDIVSIFDDKIVFVDVSLSGALPSTGDDHEVVFFPMTGATDQYGSITIESYGTETTINVMENGISLIQ